MGAQIWLQRRQQDYTNHGDMVTSFDFCATQVQLFIEICMSETLFVAFRIPTKNFLLDLAVKVNDRDGSRCSEDRYSTEQDFHMSSLTNRTLHASGLLSLEKAQGLRLRLGHSQESIQPMKYWLDKPFQFRLASRADF